MTWECPYYINVTGTCTKLEKTCQPLQKGCELEGKVRFVGSEENTEQKDKEKY